MAHLVLSPHPDDAVLSCGGLIYQLAQSGEHVTVFTAMAGTMPPDVEISSFIEEHIIRWQLGPNPGIARREEDRRSLAALGADVIFGPFPDALYRTDGHGNALYPDLERLFGDVHPDDPMLDALDMLTTHLDPALTIFAPLGAGHHVDHLIVRDAVLQWRDAQPEVAVFFYEEYPYSADGADVIQAARASLDQPVVPVIRKLNDAALAAKIRAIACHTSQISTFWRDENAMADAVRD